MPTTYTVSAPHPPMFLETCDGKQELNYVLLLYKIILACKMAKLDYNKSASTVILHEFMIFHIGQSESQVK